MKETKLQQTIGVIKNLFRTIKQRLLFPLAGSLKKTDVVAKTRNWIENIILSWKKTLYMIKFGKIDLTKEKKFIYTISDIRKANSDMIKGKKTNVNRKKYSASEMNDAWLKITSK